MDVYTVRLWHTAVVWLVSCQVGRRNYGLTSYGFNNLNDSRDSGREHGYAAGYDVPELRARKRSHKSYRRNDFHTNQGFTNVDRVEANH